MGLDMYLEAEKYVSGYDFNKDGRDKMYRGVLDAVGGAHLATKEAPSLTVTVTVAYWRKANAIHAWFVNNCAEGVDDCKQVYVGRERLVELLDVVNEVLADPTLAPKLLPSQSGFFFGGTEYDDWYMNDLNLTKEQLESVLEKVPEDSYEWDFYYRASW